MIDLWVIAHVLFWAAIGGWVNWFLNGLPLPWMLVIVGYGSIVWEVIEVVREGWLHQEPEAWLNRLAIDPLSNTIGALAGWYAARLLF